MKRLTTIILFALAMTLITGCGATKSGSNNQGSRSAVPTNFDPEDHGYLAECNTITTNNYGFEGPVSIYIDPNTKQYIDNVIRLKLNRVPTELLSNSDFYVQIFRWYEESEGNKKYNQTPVTMHFQMKGQYNTWLNTTTEVLSKNVIQNIIVNEGLSSQGITTNNFLSSVIIHLAGMDLQYDAMTIALYDQSQGTGNVGSVDVLIPAFSANPNTYATNHDSMALEQLHPMWAYKDQGYSDEQFWVAANSLCKGF